MSTREAILAWAKRMAEVEEIGPVDRFVIQSDGCVYALDEGNVGDALGWWPIPYLGPEGEAELASGALYD